MTSDCYRYSAQAYAHPPSNRGSAADGTVQTIMLAEVVVGESYSVAPGQFSDNKPPLKPESFRQLKINAKGGGASSHKIAVQSRYDCVCGHTNDFGGSDVFVVYSCVFLTHAYQVESLCTIDCRVCSKFVDWYAPYIYII